MRKGEHHSLGHTFAWPVAIAITTIGALLLGLLGDGVLDWLAAIGLAAPLALGLMKALR